MDEPTLPYETPTRGSGWATAGAILVGIWGGGLGLVALGLGWIIILMLPRFANFDFVERIWVLMIISWDVLLLHASVSIGKLAIRVNRGDAEAASAGLTVVRVCIAFWLMIWIIAIIWAKAQDLSGVIFVGGIPLSALLLVTAYVLARAIKLRKKQMELR